MSCYKFAGYFGKLIGMTVRDIDGVGYGLPQAYVGNLLDSWIS
jgi:hypothetical protein